MKKLLKENKGFSLVELLIALLIMAVIAGTAITLFGGVLETSKVRADNETAESIKRAILTYMNASNDTDLSCLGVADGDDEDAVLIDRLSKKITIEDTVTVTDSEGTTTDLTSATVDPNDIKGKYGPFFEKSVIEPAQNATDGWKIEVDPLTMIISVEATSGGSLTIN